MKTLDEKVAAVKKLANDVLTEAEKRGFSIEEVEMLPGYIKNTYQLERDKETPYKRKPQE